MSQNFNDNDTPNTTGGTGFGGTSDASTGLSTTSTGTGGGSAAGTATAPSTSGIASQAKEYGQKVADAATKAKDYLSDRASQAGEKIQDLRNVDYGQLAEDAKDYARQKPGQAILIAAAAGFVVGLLLRGSRR
ncbi:MAG TPA: DUF883 C-terminal domain-containing protein [Pyrinomonadaceae bacterium]